jgi:bacterioferritin-associated ferredoxin
MYICKCNHIRQVDLDENPDLAVSIGNQCGECLVGPDKISDEDLAKFNFTEITIEDENGEEIEIDVPSDYSEFEQAESPRNRNYKDKYSPRQRLVKDPPKTDEPTAEETFPKKVVVTLRSGKFFWGRVYLQKNQRLSDLLNDSRVFIPISKLHDNRGTYRDAIYTTIIIHKDSIQSLEDSFGRKH